MSPTGCRRLVLQRFQMTQPQAECSTSNKYRFHDAVQALDARTTFHPPNCGALTVAERRLSRLDSPDLSAIFSTLPQAFCFRFQLSTTILLRQQRFLLALDSSLTDLA
jgi:hypothetical protein